MLIHRSIQFSLTIVEIPHNNMSFFIECNPAPWTSRWQTNYPSNVSFCGNCNLWLIRIVKLKKKNEKRREKIDENVTPNREPEREQRRYSETRERDIIYWNMRRVCSSDGHRLIARGHTFRERLLAMRDCQEILRLLIRRIFGDIMPISVDRPECPYQ